MVWGCFAGYSVRDLVKIEGKIIKEEYLKILRDHAIPSCSQLVGSQFIFQQENDPNHSSRLFKSFLEEEQSMDELEIMAWPPQSRYLSPVEHLWDFLDQKAKDRQPTLLHNSGSTYKMLRLRFQTAFWKNCNIRCREIVKP